MNQYLYYRNLLDNYKTYEKYIKYHKEQWALKGFARKRFERQHAIELRNYDMYRKVLKSFIRGEDKRILPKEWQNRWISLMILIQMLTILCKKIVSVLTAIEVLQFNKRNLQRMIENESHKKAVSIDKISAKSID